MFTAASIVLDMENLLKTKLNCCRKIAKMGWAYAMWPAAAGAAHSGRRAGWHGTARAPAGPASDVRLAAPAPPPTTARRRPPASPPSPACPIPAPARLPLRNLLHQRFRFVILIRLTERCGRWTDERLLRSASCSRRTIPISIRTRTRVRSPTLFNINYLSTPNHTTLLT